MQRVPDCRYRETETDQRDRHKCSAYLWLTGPMHADRLTMPGSHEEMTTAGRVEDLIRFALCTTYPAHSVLKHQILVLRLTAFTNVHVSPRSSSQWRRKCLAAKMLHHNFTVVAQKDTKNISSGLYHM